MLGVTSRGQKQEPSPVQRPVPHLSSLLPPRAAPAAGTGAEGVRARRGAGSLGQRRQGAQPRQGGGGGGEQPGPAPPPARLPTPTQGGQGDGRRDEESKADFRQEERVQLENTEQSESWQEGERIDRVHGRKQSLLEVRVENRRKTGKIWGHLRAGREPLGDTQEIICRIRGAGGQRR